MEIKLVNVKGDILIAVNLNTVQHTDHDGLICPLSTPQLSPSSPKITNYTAINFNDGKNKLHFNAMMMMYVL